MELELEVEVVVVADASAYSTPDCEPRWRLGFFGLAGGRKLIEMVVAVGM